MNLLAIETTSSMCSVAIQVGAQIFERNEQSPNRHSQILLSHIKELLDQTNLTLDQLDAIAVGNGPGSFTGIRLGLGVAQGLSFGLKKPLICLSSLKTVAVQSTANNILVAIDARIGEVYWQCFHKDDESHLIAINKPKLCRPEQVSFEQAHGHWQGIGSGFDLYFDKLGHLLEHPDAWINSITPNAKAMIKLAGLSDFEADEGVTRTALPVYIRDQVTQ